MKIYNVARGTKGKLIINEDNEDVKIENWTVRNSMSLDNTKIIVNPELYRPRSATPLSIRGK